MRHKKEQVSLDDVIKFFTEEIDGMGRLDGHPRNQYLPTILTRWEEWELRELTEEEFFRLIIPDGLKLLLKDKEISSVEGKDSIATMEKFAAMLSKGETLQPLIIRIPLPGDTINASFYIEDGAHRALGYKIFFQSNPYVPVKAYVGR